MTMLDAEGDLAAAEIAFFSLALAVSVFVLLRQGFKKQLGWLYISLLSVLQLIGSGSTLYVETHTNPSYTAVALALALSAVGTSPLIVALMGFLERINENMGSRGVPKKIFSPLHLLSLAALVLIITGGNYLYKTEETEVETGAKLLKAGAILLLVLFVVLAAIIVVDLTRQQDVPREERNLLWACTLAAPFILVRLIFLVCVAFATTGSIFAFGNVNILLEAFMSFLMTAVAVIIFIIAGLTVPRVQYANKV